MTALQMTESLYIGGRWDPGSTGDSITVVNPATEEEIGRVPQAAPADVERAIDAAHAAFADGRGAWPSLAPRERSRLLHAFCDEVEARLEDFVRLGIVEAGHAQDPPGRLGMVANALRQTRIWADRAATFAFEEPLPPARGLGTIGQSVIRKEPVGVVAAITPFNAPTLLNLWKIGPALAMGNTVVLKPSPYTPLSALLLGRVAERVGLPAGVVNIVTGDRDAGELLTTHPKVDMVTFTGSDLIGRQVAAQAAGGLKRVVLELGGKSAAIVFGDADLDDSRLVGSLVAGFTTLAGQGCSLTTRILVEESVHDDLVSRIVGALRAIKVGDPADPSVTMGPLIRATQRDRVERYIERGRAEGAELVSGGGRPADLARGYFLEPTLFTGVSNDMTIAREEIFGPVGVVIPFCGTEQAIRLANDSPFGLGGAVWSGDRRCAFDVADRLRTGSVSVNGGSGEPGGPSGPAPFGGYKQSGLGREHGDAGAHEFLELKTVSYPIG